MTPVQSVTVVVLSILATIDLTESQAQVYTVDDSLGLGRRFDGIGSISGGGATSRLLVNYPEPQRSEILDYLFKPNYGASLHMFKAEIGGDAQSSDGGEASHMHESWDENYERGYEWWLMTEARKRNPDILLYGLPWSFPAWIGNGTYNGFYNNTVTADYIIRWINAAENIYNVSLDYIGIWNERNYSSSYIKNLRGMLDERGFSHVRICAPDQHDWLIAEDMMTDSQLMDSVDFIGTHYPDALSSDTAVNIGKPLWASEDHGFHGVSHSQSASCRARMLNLNYIIGKMTATLSWNLITSYYPGLPFPGSGLMTATEPWSGHYTVDAPIWVSAHTTQFTKPGWRYLAHGSGVGLLYAGGSYVTFTNPNTHDITIVIETMTQQHTNCINSPYTAIAQDARFRLSGSYAKITKLQVWYSKLGYNGESSTLFKYLGDIAVDAGYVNLALGVDEVFTLTTLTVGQKGSAPDPPPSRPFPLPYNDNFEGYKTQTEPNNLAQQIGVWEAVNVGPPHNGIIRQVVTEHPVYWCWGGTHPENNTLNVIGDYDWADIGIKVDARIPSVNGTDGLYVAVRIDTGGCHASQAKGIFFFIFPTSQEFQVTNDLALTTTITAGHFALSTEWNTISLSVKGNRATGKINNQSTFNIEIPVQPANGFVGFGTLRYGLAEFDNLEITSATGKPMPAWPEEKDDKTLYFKPEA